jgi:hypothetical protein
MPATKFAHLRKKMAQRSRDQRPGVREQNRNKKEEARENAK